MSTTDELLEEMLEDAEEYATPVTDDDLQFWINEHLRVISIPKNGVVAGVEGDKNVNKIKFGMNRYYHGFDMSTFSGRILYSNAKGNKNYYNITDMQASGSAITFSWLVDADAVQYMGKTAFVVYLFKIQGSELRQKFYSTLATVKVLEGMEVDSAVPVEKQTDIIERMKEEISAYAEEVKKSLPADYTAMTEQVNSLKEDLVSFTPDSKVMYDGSPVFESFGSNKRWLYSSHTIGYAVQNGVSYASFSLENIDSGFSIKFSDIDSLGTITSNFIIGLATSGKIGGYAEDYLSPENIKSNYKDILLYDNKEAIFNKAKIKEIFPNVTHIFINLFSDFDTVHNIVYTAEKSTNEKFSDIRFELDGAIQKYFLDEVVAVTNTIYGESVNKCLVLNIVTDNHYAPQRARSWQQNLDTMNNIRAVNNGIFCDGVIHLGDMVSQSYRTEMNATHEQVFLAIFKYTNEFRKLHKHVFMLGGNHDGKYANTWHQSDWYRLGQRHMDNYVFRGANSGDFYYDYPAQKVRCIFLQTPDDDTVGFGYSSGLLSWLKETLLSVQNGWTCILFSHCPNITLTTVSGVNKEMVNKDLFENMINAYNSKSGEFESAHGVVRLMVCGHAHGDYISLPNNDNGDNNKLGIPVVLIGANIQTDSNDWGVAPDRKDRTVTQDLWDTLVYYPDQNKCNFVRFGARATENRTRVVDLPI